jgi:preprotein translocase subunit SecA
LKGSVLKNRRRAKPRAVKPDDYFAAGPIEFARFGKTTGARSRATPEQFAELQAKMAESYPTIVAEIDALVASIAGQVKRLPPDRLMHRAWWEFAATVVRINEEKAEESQQLDAMRMVDYVQSVIASVKPGTYASDVSEEEWNKLKADVTTLFHRLTLEYQMCLTAHRKVQDPNLDMELEEFRVRAEMLWLNIRGKRYQVHERQALLDVLSPHSDILLRLFGMDAAELVEELDKILQKLSRGMADVMLEFSAFQDDTLTRFENLSKEHPELDFEALRDKVFEDKDLAARRDRTMGGLFGLDLFDVGMNTSLPKTLTDELTWSPGEDTEFFGPGEFQGWPLRIWPTMKRPFIRLDGRTLCFDFFSLFDNIYRVLRRVIIQKDASYSGIWNDRQKVISEELPFTYLNRILPGATIYRPVYYRWKAGAGSAEWHEADGILIWDDHLLVIEVKGGSFTYTSPANDLPAHLDSLRNLLEAPARQGSRFVDYLESAAEVSISDRSHNEIAKLRRDNFRHITICAVTLDAFTALAARAQHLGPVGISVGNRPVWPISIDDLRVYAELFDNPLTFLHFIEQRMRAGQSKHIDLNDEMDHLGLYIEQNNYSQFAAEIIANELDKLGFTGFTTPVDEYFRAVLLGDPPKPLRQSMPARLAEIIDFLATSNEVHRSELASFLLDAGGEFRTQITEAIDQALNESKELRRTRPLSVYGGMAMTLYVWSPSAPRLTIEAEEHTRAVMVANDEVSRRLIELEYNEAGTLIGAHMKHVTLAALASHELERIRQASLSLRRARLTRARAKGKIGRNDSCPCGSGKKYKRCHGR